MKRSMLVKTLLAMATGKSGGGLYPTLEVTITNGTATSVTATLNSTVVNLTYDSTAGVWRGTLKAFGTWSVEASNGEKTVSDTVTISSVAVYTLTLDFTMIYGVEWDGSSTTAWTRTDAAANFTDPVPYVAGATSYGSPFDTIQPWAGMVKENRTGGVMVAIPKFWYKITQSGNGLKIQIADGAVDGFSVSPAHMDRGDGKGERNVVYVGRYHCANSTYKSETGKTPKVNVNRSPLRTQCHNLGSTTWLMGWPMRFTLLLLYLVEFADWNSQEKIGYGCGNNSDVQNMGYTDSMPYHTGTTLSSKTTFGLGTQYRYIEGLWDNVFDYIDECYNSSNGLMLILNPANSSDSSGGVSVGTPSNGMPSKFTYKNVSGTFPLFIPTEANGSATTYSCDRWFFGAIYHCPSAGGWYNQSNNHGLFAWNATDPSSGNAYFGGRLQELP